MYIWMKQGKPWKESKDVAGKVVRKEYHTGGVYVGHNYHTDHTIESDYWYKNNELHRDDDEPTVVWYKNDGSITNEFWYKEGKQHRGGDKPAAIVYKEGSICRVVWYKDGECHRDGDKPAIICYNKDGSIGNQFWYKNGKKVYLDRSAKSSKSGVCIYG